MNREASPTHRITTETELRAVIGEPNDVVLTKISDRLHPITRGFIDRSPFVVLATADAGGRCDVSPRGDPAGFVRIVDDTTLLIPERPGNKIADSLRNIVQTGRVGLLFVIPGITDTFRVNGRAFLTTDPLFMEPSAVEGQIPRLGIVVHIEEAYTQCSKAFLRSHLWDPSRYSDRSELPTNGEIMRCLNGDGFDADAYDQARSERYARREGFYRP